MKRRTESEIMALKSQEAKDYCLELIEALEQKSREPLSPGEVQLQELHFDLQLKEAEVQDNIARHQHEVRLKELELEIERERARHAENQKAADAVRQDYAQTIKQVSESQEMLSTQLERTTREHTVKLQLLEAEYAEKSQKLKEEIDTLTQRRDELVGAISSLGELEAAAEEVASLRNELATRNDLATKELKELDAKIEAAKFEKEKELTKVRREQELGIAELHAEHRKELLSAKADTVEKLLTEIGDERISPAELAALKTRADSNQRRSDEELAQIRESAADAIRKQYNIMADANTELDVTALFYQEKATQEENVGLEKHVQKLEEEIARMRTHIEGESERLAKAVEAARTSIQNNIEPGVQR